MTSFLMRVHAVPGNKIIFQGPRPKGYYQTLGVTVRQKTELLSYVRDFIMEDTGGSVVEIDDIVVADIDGKHQSIRDLCGDRSRLGVWYMSGKAFFFDDDDD
jgi:hypothetical protein